MMNRPLGVAGSHQYCCCCDIDCDLCLGCGIELDDCLFDCLFDCLLFGIDLYLLFGLGLDLGLDLDLLFGLGLYRLIGIDLCGLCNLCGLCDFYGHGLIRICESDVNALGCVDRHRRRCHIGVYRPIGDGVCVALDDVIDRDSLRWMP
jgi:hypothetical protein